MKEFIGIILFIGLLAVGAVFLPELDRAREEADQSRPSIAALKDSSIPPSEPETFVATPEPAPAETTPATPAAPETPAVDPATLAVTVLNGGAAGGSAGKAATVLKTAGYKLATASDARGNYTGVTVYFQSGKDKEAEAVRQALLATYPNAVAKAAVSATDETGKTTVVVIMGR